MLRTREQHLRDCDNLEANIEAQSATSTDLGINYRSVLFELQHFSVDSLLQDVIHNVLEGTMQYKAKLVLQHATVIILKIRTPNFNK